ncbi:MAG: putative flavoprotein involved in transport [Chloroflexota bacterium]|jgi:putative flavoprotein involved in K+ transport|nr:putative flavoprotein involved in transport [Chloroflexota bacterium]
MAERFDVVVIGAGQAGLSISHELTHAGVDHVVLERRRVAESWRGRWDSFCLVTPNWMVNLAGQPYSGSDPDGFMPRDELVDYIAAYAASFKAPVREGVQVTELTPREEGGFLVRTSAGDFEARDVVVASGGYQKPFRPPGASELPPGLHVIDVEEYTNPGALPEGRVLVMGSGQTGCQLAEELFEAGRDVSLACGRAPWIHRRTEGRDTLAVLVKETRFMEMTLADLPGPMARLGANPQASGHDGGHDLNYRTLQAMGVHLLGRFTGADETTAHFADDLAASVAFGDARYLDLCGLVLNSCAARGIAPPEMPPPGPFDAEAPTTLDLEDFAAGIFTSGFRPDYSWVKAAGAFDAMGFPVQVDGSSTVVPGLHFMGVHFQRKRKSAVLWGVGEDATVLAERILAKA